MKVAMLRNKLTQEGLDGLLVTDKINRRYLCGFTGSNGLLLVTQNKQVLMIDGRYTEQAKQQTKNKNIEVLVAPVGQSIYTLLSQFSSYKHLGFEEETIGFKNFQVIQSEVDKFQGKLIATHNIVESMRSIKSAEEVLALRKAAAIADATLEEIIPLIQVGMTELELANEIDYRSKKLGSEGPAFETIVASGNRTALPHAHASQKVIQVNELIMIDFGAIFGGYYSDTTRTFAFGKVSDAIKNNYQKLLNIQKQTIASIKIGQTFEEVDCMAREKLKNENLGEYFTHNLGHGIGLSCHEYPAVALNQQELVQSMMTFTVEPGIYLPEKYGIRIEDDVLINSDGTVECLTKFSKEWMEV